MTQFDKTFIPVGIFRLLAVAWGIFTLLLLGQAVRNGHYVPVPDRPQLVLDTRTGRVHPLRVADSFTSEAQEASQDKQEALLRQALTQ